MALEGVLAKLFVSISADISDFTTKMSEVRQESDATAKALEANFKRLGIGMVALGGAITTFAAVSVKDFARTGDQLVELSQQTGFSTEWLSKMSYVASLTGSSIEGLALGSKLLSQQLIQASSGSKEAQASFAKLGLSYEALRAMSPEQQFETVLKALGDMPDSAEKAAMAVAMFGRSGTQMLPMIADGAEGLEEMMHKAEELGYVMSEEAAESANKLQDALDNVGAAMKGMKNTIGDALAPMLTKLADLVSGLLAKWSEFAEANPVLARTIVMVTVALGGLLLVGGTYLIFLPQITAMIATLTVAIGALTWPIAAVVLAVTALAAAFLYLSNRADEANRKRLAAEKVALEEKKRLLAEELAQMKAAYAEEIRLIGTDRDAKLKAIDDEAGIAERYYNWKLGQLEATRDAELAALDSEKAIAERYYDWQLGKLGDVRDARIEDIQVQLDAARKAYDAQRKAVEDQTNAEIASISRVRDERLAALQEQLDAMDRLDILDQREQINARKREIEGQLEIVQTEEKRQELLAEYASLNKDLAGIDRQEKRSAILEEMDNIRAAADLDIQASQDRMAAAIAGLDATLQAAIANSQTATDQANADYEAAQLNLETLINTSMAGTAAETALITAKWAEEMKGQLDYQTQWQLDYDARVAAIQTEYEDAKKALEDLIASGVIGTAEETAAIALKWDTEMKGNLDFQTQWQLDHQARIDAITEEADHDIAEAARIEAEKEAANKAVAALPMPMTDVEWNAIVNPPKKYPWWDVTSPLVDSLSSMFGSIGGIFGMQHGGRGEVYQPTLFLAGETGRESFAFGKQAESKPISSSVDNGLAVHIHAGIFMGSQAEAEKIGSILNPILRRQMRANTGEALW